FIGNFGQFAASERAADEQSEDGIGLRVLLGDDGGQSVAREAADGGGNFFANVLSSAFDVPLENESASDIGVAFAGINGNFVDAADGRDGVCKRKNGAGDDFFGSGAGEIDVDIDGRWIGFGEEIDGEAAVRKDAEGHEKSDEHHGEDRILDADFGDS